MSYRFGCLCEDGGESDPSIDSAQRPKEVVNESPLHELCEVPKVDSVVEDVIDPEGGPEGGLSNKNIESDEFGLSIWTLPSDGDLGGSSYEKELLMRRLKFQYIMGNSRRSSHCSRPNDSRVYFVILS